MEELAAENKDLKREVKSLKETLNETNEERDQLYTDLGTAINEIDDLEQYTCKHNLEIHGILEKTEEYLAEQVIKTFDESILLFVSIDLRLLPNMRPLEWEAHEITLNYCWNLFLRKLVTGLRTCLTLSPANLTDANFVIFFQARFAPSSIKMSPHQAKLSRGKAATENQKRITAVI